MLADVLASLKKTSKGSLHYDRSWLFEGRANEILQDVLCLTRLHSSPLKEDSLDNEIVRKQSEPSVEREAQKSDVPLPRSSPSKEPQGLQDNCFQILKYEDGRRKKVQETVHSFMSEIDNFGEEHCRHIEQQMALLQQSWRIADQQRTDQIARQQLEELLEVKEQQNKLKEHQKTHANRLNEKMREMEERQRQQEELEQRRRQVEAEVRHQLLSIRSQLQALASIFAEVLGTCPRPDLLRQEPRLHLAPLLEAQQTLEQILDCRELCVEKTQQAQAQFLAAKAAFSQLQADVVQVNAKLKEEAMMKQKEREEKQANVGNTSPQRSKDSLRITSTQESQVVKGEPPRDLGILAGCIDPESHDLYLSVVKATAEWEETYRPLVDDPSLKKLQFEMKKAVNTPVNAISSQSGHQLSDKLERLSRLLAGGAVPGTAGKTPFTCRQHPLGVHFCAHLLAKKIVSQAESQVSSHQEAAFPLAAVTVGLWTSYPKFGELLLGQLYLRCPYLLPIYHQKEKGQDEKDYHLLLGYKYENGEMEAQDQFLKRMGGIVCFYAALIQTSAPPSLAASRPHPHGIQHGWQFLARLVNLRPRFDITATVLFHFLEVAGSALYRTYGRQMHKLVNHLHSEYMPQIHKVTLGESGGPISRLENFLSSTARSGRIAVPAGTITTGFWNT